MGQGVAKRAAVHLKRRGVLAAAVDNPRDGAGAAQPTCLPRPGGLAVLDAEA